MLTADQETWLRTRIVQLRSRQAAVGPFRAAGIARTIAGMKQQLRGQHWSPPVAPNNPIKAETHD